MSIAEDVARGAQWLDKNEPGWAETVEQNMNAIDGHLEMANNCRCVLGWIERSSRRSLTPFSDFVERHKISRVQIDAMGFDRDEKDLNEWEPEANRLWLAEIEERTAP